MWTMLRRRQEARIRLPDKMIVAPTVGTTVLCSADVLPVQGWLNGG
jgi:hypothetical protein